MIANEPTLHQRPNDVEVSNYKAFNNELNPYRISTYMYTISRNDKCKANQTRKRQINRLILPLFFKFQVIALDTSHPF